MSGSKACGDDQHRPASSPTKTRQQNNLLQEAIPFDSPASPIPKQSENHIVTTAAADYPHEIPGSSNDTSSEPYLLSSMSEEDLQHNQNGFEERGGGGGGPSSTGLPQDHHNPYHSTAISSSTSFEETTPLHMDFEVKPSTSSDENKFHNSNTTTNNNNEAALTPQQNVVVASAPAINNNTFPKKELTCVTDVVIPTTIPSIPTSGSFSPLGNSVTSMDTMTPTGGNNRFHVPKFYDSEEEGVEGSLVLVPSTSKSMTSPRMVVPSSSSVGGGGGGNGGGGNNQTPPQPPLPKDHRHGLTTTPAHLLPYQQRKKLIVEQQQPTSASATTATADKRPPVPPSSAKLPSFPMTSSSELPPPMPSGAELAKKYGGVAEIPPFRGGGGVSSGQQQELGTSGDGGDNDHDDNIVDEVIMTPMKKSKSADASNKVISSPVNNKKAAVATDNNREQTMDNTDTSSKEAPHPPPPPPPPPAAAFQEVICPPQPPSPSMRSGSPGEGSYHIRVSSCGSISSLGSMAVDSDSIRHAPRRDHPNNQHGFQQQHYPQMQPPPPPPNHYYGGYPQPQQQMRGGNPPNNGSGFVDLSQDIAMYLHGEQIANGEVSAAAHHHHHGEYPPQNYWNHDAAAAAVYGYYPQSPQVEPIPPPLTQVPNMQMGHRSRLPSISDDDWSEDIEKYKADMEDGNRGGGGVQHPYPLPPHRSYNNYGGRDRMAYPHQLPPPAQNRQRDQRKRMENYSQQQQQQRSENRANERSSLLASNNNRSYDEYGGGSWNGSNGNGNNDPNASYYKTPPRRKKNTQETKSTKRKKSKRRRRTEKEKLRNLHSTDSSEEDEKQLRRSVRTSRRKKRHGGGGRKRRGDDDISDTMSETYSESFMTTASLTDRLKSAEASVNVFQRMMIRTKLLICNLPLSAAAISFSIVLLGIVWLRRAEEILTSCKEVNFHSSQCNFPEFPGCYFCDTFDHWYQAANKFHTICSYVGGFSVALYAAKAVLFGRVFIDEMSSPTTASPAGLIFMTMALAFTGKGPAGAVAVFVASFLHLALLLWFIYMSLAYQTMPDPSWFPNTIGIGLCAVKVWFYNPLCGHFLIAMTLMLTFLYYPISLIRVALNEKMSSTICWMQMICPAISLYSLAIVMQPSFKEERPDISNFQTMQRSVYLPSMTCLFGLCIIGMLSSLHGLVVRWKQIQKEEFTPAHAAYSFPLLMHALAVQAYRSSLGFFSETGEVNPALKYALEIYWVVLVTVGSFVAVVCVLMYLSFLPSWIDVNTCDEVEPPAPNETSMFETVTWGESLIQPYVSPTILQSNEAGVLVMTHDYENNWDALVRTKNVPAVGFEPMMRRRTFNRERDALKHLVGGQDVIHEGDESHDDFCFDDVNV